MITPDNRVQLRTVVQFHYGSALKAGERIEAGRYVVYGSNGPVGKHNDRLVNFPTIVVGRKGSVGSLYYAPEGGWPIDTTYYTEILDSSRLDLRYLYYALKQAKLGRHTIVTSIPGLNRDALYRTEIPLPYADDPARSLREQKRIAAILDKADAIRRKRQLTIKNSSHLVESGFSHLFGDTLVNPRGFVMGTLEELAGTVVDCPHSTPTYSDNETDYYCVRSSDIQDGCINLAETRHVTESTYIERIGRHEPRPGEVVYTREGGRLGNAAQLPAHGNCCLGQRMMLFTARADVSTSEFIWALLNSPGLRHQVNSLIGGAAAPRINIADIRKFQVPLPPYELQLRFSAFVNKIRDQAIQVNDSQRELQDLFNSLVQRAFKGEL